MHAGYAFLVEVGSDLMVDPAANLVDIGKDAVDIFESSVERYFDENNWYTPMAVVTQCGLVGNLVNDTDFRGRETFADEIKNQCSPAEQWQNNMLFALKCCSSGMQIFKDNEDDLLTFEQLAKKIESEVPMALSDLYRLSINNIHMKNTAEKYNGHNEYMRMKLSRCLEHYTSADIIPFSRNVICAYDYRAFDLRRDTYGSELDKSVVMLWVDIHT